MKIIRAIFLYGCDLEKFHVKGFETDLDRTKIRIILIVSNVDQSRADLIYVMELEEKELLLYNNFK
jgi:hypothetical protein